MCQKTVRLSAPGEDGTRKILVVAFDLLGLDHWFSRGLREKCAAPAGRHTEEQEVTSEVVTLQPVRIIEIIEDYDGLLFLSCQNRYNLI